ncbi:MAG: flagellar basal body rod protein FlgB [Nitrospinota bacterium]|nr:flagellar basal body rod protein FlgB [Nitrospinota bacterium]
MSFINNLLFSDRAPKVVKKSLDFNSQKAAMTAANIANAETPRYKAKSVEFESILQSVTSTDFLQIKATHSKHISPQQPDFNSMEPELTIDFSQGRIDGNNVDLDKEVTTLSETKIAYDAAITVMTKRGGIIRAAVTETR